MIQRIANLDEAVSFEQASAYIDRANAGNADEPRGLQMHHQTTIDQIGRVTLGSVGARAFVYSADALTFTISRGHRRVTITLDPDDTYHVQTRMIRSGAVVFDRVGVYCDMLAEAVWDAHIEQR